MTTSRRFCAIVPLTGVLLASMELAQACTGIQVRTKDGALISGRTLEFGADLESKLLVVPRGMKYTGTAPGDRAGLNWTTKYGVVGMNGLSLPHYVEGVNEKGLGVGLFYFPGFAKYQSVSERDVSRSLAAWELGTYLLTTCAAVEDAVQAVKGVIVGPTVYAPWKLAPPAHYRLQDASGKAAVLEYVDGKLNVHVNPLGVLTNAPTFDWHLTNLRNYVKLSAMTLPTVDLGNLKLAPLGQGSGMLGLPGDFTPPSRFVRAVAFSQSAVTVANATEGVKQVFHILNNFDIPKGSAREESEGKVIDEYTQWTSVSDLTARVFYFRTYSDSRVRTVDLKRCDLDAREFKYISIGGEEAFEEIKTALKRS